MFGRCTPKKKMDKMYELCEMLKDGYVDSYDRIRERLHLVMFFSAVQPDFKQLSLAKRYIRKPSSKQELYRYLVVCKNDGDTQEKGDDVGPNGEDCEITREVESDTETELESDTESEEQERDQMWE